MVWLPTGKQHKTVGTKIVAFLRATDHTEFAIGNDLNDLDQISLLKIGYGKASKVRKDFEHVLSNCVAIITQPYYIEKIAQLDTSRIKAYKDGCIFYLIGAETR